MRIDFQFVVVKPFQAEHPIGSGALIWFQPGDIAPASEWGRAAQNMVEMGKLVRLAVNVPEEGEDVAGYESSDEDFPKHIGAGWHILSDGSRVRGRDVALAAEKKIQEETTLIVISESVEDESATAVEDGV